MHTSRVTSHLPVDIQCRAMKRLVLVCASYILLSAIIFFPLLREFNGVVAAGGDSYFLIWNMWWVHEGQHKPGQSLLWTDYQFHPTGTSLLLQPFDMAQIAWVWPIYSLWGPIVANSVVVFISFFLTGFCTFLLARMLGLTDGAAFVSGLVFMMSSFHFHHIQGGHTSLASLYWLPLFCVALIFWWRKPSARFQVWLGVAFWALFYTNWYLTACGLLFAICWLGVSLWERPALTGEKPRWLGLVGALALGFAGVAPILVPAVLHAREFVMPFGHVPFSADVLSFFVPGQFSAWGDLTSVWQGFTGNGSENGNYLGFVALILAAVGIRFCRESRVWMVVIVLAVLLSLGPYLHVNGRWEFATESLGPLRAPAEWVSGTARRLNPSWCVAPGHVAVPLPYLGLKEIPFFSTARAPARFMALTFLALAVSAGFGTNWLLGRFEGRRRVVVLSTLVLLMVVEHYPRLSFVRPEADPFFGQLAATPGDFAILDCSEPWLRLYNQTIHGKRMVGGYVGREQIKAQQVLGEAGVEAWMNGHSIERDLRQVKDWLIANQVRFVVVPGSFEEVRAQLQQADFQCVYRSDRIVVYACTVPQT